jgi:hypothetical protein
MRNDGTSTTNQEHNFGLLDENNNRLPAYNASKYLFSFTANATSAKYFIDEDEKYVVLKLGTGTGAVKYVLWSYGDGDALKLDASHLPPRAVVTDMYGKVLTTTNVLAVPEARGPVFVSVPS